MKGIIGIITSLFVLAGAARAEAAKQEPRRIAIEVTERGFGPDHIAVHRGEPVTLVFTRKTERTCAKQITVDLGEGKKVEKKLPLGVSVDIPATFTKTGKLAYACSMDMISGEISVGP